MTKQRVQLAGCTFTQICDNRLGSDRLGPYGKYHGLANSMAFTREFAVSNRYDPTAAKAEETSFTDHFKKPMAQLDPYKVCVQFVHANTFDKRKLILDSNRPGTKVQKLTAPLQKLFGKQKGACTAYQQAAEEAVVTFESALPFAGCDVAIYLGAIRLSDEQLVLLVQWLNMGYRNSTQNVVVFQDYIDSRHCEYDEASRVWWADLSLFSFRKEYATVVLAGYAGQWPLLCWQDKIIAKEIVCDCTFAHFDYDADWIYHTSALLERTKGGVVRIEEKQAEAIKTYSSTGASLVCSSQTQVCSLADPEYHKTS